MHHELSLLLSPRYCTCVLILGGRNKKDGDKRAGKERFISSNCPQRIYPMWTSTDHGFLSLTFTLFVDPTNLGRSCDEVVCTYGAECEQDGDRAGCMCNIVCSDMTENEVRKYISEMKSNS
jgi:hypothetical protein